MGYVVLVIETDVLSRGLPVRRTRVCFIAVLEPQIGYHERLHFQHQASWLTQVTAQPPTDIREFLLDPEDPDHALWEDKMHSKAARSSAKRVKSRKIAKWRSVH